MFFIEDFMIQLLALYISSSLTVAYVYDVNLPDEHLAFFYNSNPLIAEACKNDTKCPHKMHLNHLACWGYEANCSATDRYQKPVCPEGSKGWAKTKQEQEEIFYKQGDFGYINDMSQEITTYCKPEKPDDSSLECTKFVRYCKAKNILIDFTRLLTLPEPIRYREDVLKEGLIGGSCKLNKTAMKVEGYHKSPLQSWYAELENFVEMPKLNLTQKCDIVINRPTFLMKLDATVNMYHHFCDFFNLYATQHLNGSFNTNVNILIWDTLPYRSNFEVTWKAFTEYPILDLGLYKGKKVCFKEAIFPLLPRMIFGMYYNMPLIPGCYGSGLFHAFNRHILHRLNINQRPNKDGKVRITFLSRETEYRRILNENELIDALKENPLYLVKKVNYNRSLKFLDQLEITYNSDIFIGIHGAGLSHILFLPDWAAVFELYNCDDESCYYDLARLRGVKYLTWQNNSLLRAEDKGNHPTLGAHAKFTNYFFDVLEFTRIVSLASDYVISHHMFKKMHMVDNHRHTEL